MRSKQLLKNLKKALQQDYLYDSTELKFMREQLSILEKFLLLILLSVILVPLTFHH